MDKILNGKKRPILVADADHHRSGNTCMGLHGLDRIVGVGGRKVLCRRRASPLDSRIEIRPGRIALNSPELIASDSYR